MGFWSLFFSSKPFEVQASIYEKSELELGDETFRLVKLNGKYVALYFDGASSKTFEIFSSKKAEEARSRFEMLQHKFPKLLSCSGEPVTSILLKEVLDAIEKNPQFGITHLMVLIGTGECASNKSVLKQINDPTPDYGMSPLHLAIKLENIQVIRKLLDLGAKTSEVDSEGRTAYHYAANCVHSEIIEMLASKDISSIDKFSNMGETALHEACLNGLPSNVEKLLDAKANPSITKSFRYPIHCAIFLDNVEIVDMLCDGRPEQLELKESSIGNTAAHCFRSKEMLRCLKKHNVNLDTVNSLGETPLICKIKEGDFSCSLMLLVEAADASTSDLLGNSCLHLAIELDRPDLVQALLGFGAKVNVENKKGVTPRHKAAGSLGPNKDLILQYLHLVGAKRCQKSMKDCMIGCSHDSAYDGAPLTKGLTYDSTVFDYWLEVDVLNEALSRETSSRTVYGDSILTLDGGGMRGIATATILIALEKEANTPIYELFDVISGTSTGGILTMAIAYKKSLRYSISTYFRLKNEIFTGKRPYNQEILERYLKQEFGEDSKMTDIEYPRLPTELFMFKNFEVPGMHESYYSTDERFQPVPRPKDQLVWQAVRATTAATTYFRASGRFIDGAFIANNPTLDVLTELFRLNRINEVTQKIKPKPIYVVVSIGTGRPTPKQVEVCDFFRPEGLRDLGKVLSGFLGIGELLVDQVTQADGHIVRRAAAWCGMIGVPFYRFNPVISNYIPLDCTDDLVLVKLMWETQCFINQNIGAIRRLAKYLLIKKEKKLNSAG